MAGIKNHLILSGWQFSFLPRWQGWILTFECEKRQGMAAPCCGNPDLPSPKWRREKVAMPCPEKTEIRDQRLEIKKPKRRFK